MKPFWILALFAASLSPVLADSANANANLDSKISICHATHSETNPTVLITVSLSAEQAHDDHQDDEDIVFGFNVHMKSGPSDGSPCIPK